MKKVNLNTILTVGGMLRDSVKPMIEELISSKKTQPQNEKLEETGFCSACGKKLEVGDVFCSGCGKQQPIELTCQNCGCKLENDANFCPKCGKGLESL